MTITGIKIYLADEELKALELLAEQEYRQTNDQASYIVRQRLEQLGLIPESILAKEQRVNNGHQIRNAESS